MPVELNCNPGYSTNSFASVLSMECALTNFGLLSALESARGTMPSVNFQAEIRFRIAQCPDPLASIWEGSFKGYSRLSAFLENTSPKTNAAHTRRRNSSPIDARKGAAKDGLLFWSSMPDLFDTVLERDLERNAPLADRMRPRNFSEFIGQDEVIGVGTVLRNAVENDELFSMILWGPPGSGKTTLASIIARLTKSSFVKLSGVESGKDDLKRVVQAAQQRRKLHGARTILFIDEIHRWNKAQQDALLPYVEQGIVTLIGATTENPSFEVIPPLLSRSRVVVLKRLEPEQIVLIVEQAVHERERGFGGHKVTVDPKAMRLLCTVANGDARTALNALEIAVKATKADGKGMKRITLQMAADALQHRPLLYDKKGDEHYNVISAFIKSMRGSDPDAALYYLGRMLEAGEDPLFIARRMVIFASEDVGIADAQALPLAVACMHAVDLIGMPECQINLSHVAVYLATAKKSNATYVAYGQAVQDVQETLNEPVPLHLRNAPTDLMKELGYHKGYKYSHNFRQGSAEARQQYLPDKLSGKKYFTPPGKEKT